jgi:hypothetical protein
MTEQRKYDDLPLGARFRYIGNAKVYVKLENGDCGLVVEWTGVNKAPFLQGIYSLCDTPQERATFIVEVVED